MDHVTITNVSKSSSYRAFRLHPSATCCNPHHGTTHEVVREHFLAVSLLIQLNATLKYDLLLSTPTYCSLEQTYRIFHPISEQQFSVGDSTHCSCRGQTRQIHLGSRLRKWRPIYKGCFEMQHFSLRFSELRTPTKARFARSYTNSFYEGRIVDAEMEKSH
jgi:hypothetical protein